MNEFYALCSSYTSERGFLNDGVLFTFFGVFFFHSMRTQTSCLLLTDFIEISHFLLGEI